MKNLLKDPGLDLECPVTLDELLEIIEEVKPQTNFRYAFSK